MVRLESEAAAAADGDVFAALAHPVRRNILMRLRAGAHTASDLAADMPIGRPAVSEHLQALRLAKLVKIERRGRERYYFSRPTAADRDWRVAQRPARPVDAADG